MDQLKHFIKHDNNSKAYSHPFTGRGRCDHCMKQNVELIYTRSPGLMQGQICSSCAKKKGLASDNSSHNLNTPKGEVSKPYIGNVEQATLKNNNYRDTLFTGKHSQLIVMSLKPHEQIGNEVHPKVDQFFRVESGKAKFNIDNGKTKTVQGPGGAVVVPSGHYHNVTNPSPNKSLKLYTIYSPSNHPPNTVQKVRPKND